MTQITLLRLLEPLKIFLTPHLVLNSSGKAPLMNTLVGLFKSYIRLQTLPKIWYSNALYWLLPVLAKLTLPQLSLHIPPAQQRRRFLSYTVVPAYTDKLEHVSILVYDFHSVWQPLTATRAEIYFHSKLTALAYYVNFKSSCPGIGRCNSF